MDPSDEIPGPVQFQDELESIAVLCDEQLALERQIEALHGKIKDVALRRRKLVLGLEAQEGLKANFVYPLLDGRVLVVADIETPGGVKIGVAVMKVQGKGTSGVFFGADTGPKF